MNVRLQNEEDLPVLANWFSGIKWPMPGADNIIPKSFYVAEEDGELLACAGLYPSGVGAAFISWTCTSPYVTGERQNNGIMAVISHIQELAERAEPKITVLSLVTKSDAFAMTLKKLGFRAEPNVIQMTFKHGA